MKNSNSAFEEFLNNENSILLTKKIFATNELDSINSAAQEALDDFKKYAGAALTSRQSGAIKRYQRL